MLTTCPQCTTELKGDFGFCPRCGHPLGSDIMLGGALVEGRYRIVRVAAVSETGSVYEARDERLGGVQVFLKEMVTDYLEPPLRQEAAAAFSEDAYRLSSLRHDGLPAVRDYFHGRGRVSLVLDYREAESLQSLACHHGGVFTLEELLPWAVELCEVIEYLHGQSPPYLFGHIKPAHILIAAPESHVILVNLDTDIRQFISSKRQRSGTPGYRAPEQFEGKMVPGSDIYAVGQVLFFLLTGVEPNPFVKIKNSPALKALPERIARVLLKATADAPGDRFLTARALKDALRALSPGREALGTVMKPEEYTEKALIFLKNHQIDEALIECNKALLIDGSHMEAYLYLGHGALKEGRIDRAIEHYRKACALEPGDTRIHCNLALAYYYSGRMEEALTETRKALELDPVNIFARNNLGSLYREMGMLREALEEYEKALAVDSGYGAACYNLGLTHYELGNFDESARFSGKALECEPDNVYARINLGLAHFMRGDTGLFEECNREVLRYDPTNPRALNNCGVACYARGEHEQAAAFFKKAIEHDRAMESSQHNLKLVEDEKNKER